MKCQDGWKSQENCRKWGPDLGVEVTDDNADDLVVRVHRK
jgi:hypothetical protein